MTNDFGAYSRYYDLLYRNKDYLLETDYISNLLRRHGSGDSILELGCGTGKHAELLAQKGFRVTGIERSEQMLKEAQKRQVDCNKLGGHFTAMLGDARSVRVPGLFDAVISVFHVFSYQNSNEDALATLETAFRHLRHKGLFLFDVWHGPAVVHQLPKTRILRLEDSRTKVLRVAEPEHLLNQSIVNVKYSLLVTDLDSGLTSEIVENHPMRYYFPGEIDLLARLSGFHLVKHEEWLTGQQSSEETWGVTYLLQKI